MREPALTTTLSLRIPVIRQRYNGRILLGLLWLVITPGLWVGTGGGPRGVCHNISACMGYTRAGDHRVQT
jgi:hypothetical protein